jgi:polysaccharide export outer membrane protein
MRAVRRNIWLAIILFCAIGAFAQAPAKSDANTPDTSIAATTEAARPKLAPDKTPVRTPTELPDQFVAGESDVLRISVWKEPDLSQTVVVSPDGSISLPLLKDVKVAGLTPVAIENLLAEKLKVYITSPQVTVTVQEIRSRKVYITGEITRPGTYPLLTPMTVLQIISEAGGFTPFARRNKIYLLRREGSNQKRYDFDYPKVVHGVNPEQNIMLRPGDTVVVP